MINAFEPGPLKEMGLKLPWELKYSQKEEGIISKFLSIKGNSSKSEYVDPPSQPWKKPSPILYMGGLSITGKPDITVTRQVLTTAPSLPQEI